MDKIYGEINDQDNLDSAEKENQEFATTVTVSDAKGNHFINQLKE